MLKFRAAAKAPHRYESDIAPVFPDVNSLLQKAEKCTNSCIHYDQVTVSREFFKTVAMRGAFSKKYSLEDVKRATILLDYMAEVRVRELTALESVVG